ncbi:MULTISPECIES: DUF349 domain-containing protein [Chryseobacterium]|uniref:Domain of Uncharacterized Function (DUF349) n=1 Tax=Chryseobacterium taihuense TaxID=1141221 RepID=A0A4U8WAT5_9FLAO|nr:MULTISPECIES: DUF349 domain-containing protein [Chryseobacterium]QQV03252.1 DUF349 domain-containing protein [Chryseobacterium sp. FDAARGOS 1104]VFB03441.1 Domain of Uncharacterised Function (DUF349) [Chryseobacterium taihuense]
MTTENNLSENEENKPSVEVQENEQNIDKQENHYDDHDDNEHDSVAELSLSDTLKEMEKIINSSNAGERLREFNALKEKANHFIHDEIEDKKHEYTDAGNAPENFSYEHPLQSRLSALINIFREKHDSFQKSQEEEHKKNLEHRQGIIERLKNLYTNSEPGINLFKSIREIKEEWTNAGQVAKSEFKILNNNYFHHLNQFYQMLDMNKEFLEQEYSHNLEKRQHIIARAKELENEPVVQKALNELQYLHKLWKEEAEPVAEEFREKTWEEFKEISNKIHERKTELSAAIETEQNANLEKKNEIIAEIRKLSEPQDNPNHNYWQNAIKKVEELRTEFLKTGSVPRKLSNTNWTDFKTTLRSFNTTKNNYYKSLKGSQQQNLEEKMKLIQTAKDNMHSEDWDIAVALFKKLQEDWKKIGHVPKSMTNKIWDEFRDACNTFFNNYREKSSASTDNWKENYKLKKDLLEELKAISNDEGSIEKIEAIKTSWNNIGKVPRDKMAINSEFNRTLREKLKLNKTNELELKEEGLSENQLTDKARKIKSQIADLESEIAKLENNLAFFNKPTRENPLLRETYNTIDDKKAHLETLKQNLHSIISGE